MSIIEDMTINPKCAALTHICNKVEHATLNCSHHLGPAFKDNFLPQCPTIMIIVVPHLMNDSTWYIPTEATHHITGDLGNLIINSSYQSSM